MVALRFASASIRACETHGAEAALATLTSLLVIEALLLAAEAAAALLRVEVVAAALLLLAVAVALLLAARLLAALLAELLREVAGLRAR